VLHLHNSLTGRLEPFTPIDPSHVRFYACGPTVYSRAHIGNLRSSVMFDVLYRTLQHHYLKGPSRVSFVRNLTDIDDKITIAARERYPDTPIDTAIHSVTEPAIAAWKIDNVNLGNRTPTAEPRATDYIHEMLVMIETLVDAGAAYATDDGHVFFNLSRLAPKLKGILSGRMADAEAGYNRVAEQASKANQADFVLWKPSGGTQPGWASPWGRGRPGWHIECSAMSAAHLGKEFDIHAGGSDLLFPHHENEIAQSATAHGHDHPQARYWIHTGMLTVDGKKMSKSLGNVLDLPRVWQYMSGRAVRLALLSSHYRSSLDWTDELVHASVTRLDRLLDARNNEDGHTDAPPAFYAALDNDLNTPEAITVLDDAASRGLGGVTVGLRHLGIMDATGTFGIPNVVQAQVRTMITARNTARLNKDWVLSDTIRVALANAKIELRDTPNGGTTWHPLPGFDYTVLT